MDITELKNFYSFEARKEWMKLYYTQCYKESQMFYEECENGLLKEQCNLRMQAMQSILSNDNLIEKAVIIEAMQELKRIMSLLFPNFQSLHEKVDESKLPTMIMAFGYPFTVLPLKLRYCSIDEVRKILFEAVGLDFVPVEEISQVVSQYNAVQVKCRESLKNGETVEDLSYASYEMNKKVQSLSMRSLVSFEKDYLNNFPHSEIKGYTFDSLYTYEVSVFNPISVVVCPDNYICKRKNNNEKKL